LAPAPPQTHSLSLHDALPIYDRALLSSLYWFLRASPTAAYRAVRDDFLRTGKSLRALDIGVPKPWRRDIARAVVRQGHTIVPFRDRKSTRLNSSHVKISYAVF